MSSLGPEAKTRQRPEILISSEHGDLFFVTELLSWNLLGYLFMCSGKQHV